MVSHPRNFPVIPTGLAVTGLAAVAVLSITWFMRDGNLVMVIALRVMGITRDRSSLRRFGHFKPHGHSKQIFVHDWHSLKQPTAPLEKSGASRCQALNSLDRWSIFRVGHSRKHLNPASQATVPVSSRGAR